MENLKIYEIENSYIDHLVPFAPHLFHNKKENQENERKYIGIILTVNGLDYFAPLSSFKEKHKKMKNNMDFLKVGNYAVINLNNMFPAPLNLCKSVKIENIKNEHYKNLVRAEYRIIKQKTEQILINAKHVYNHKMINDGKPKLSQRCNDFKLLEEKCKEYKIPTKKK
jgi:protein AbiQ